MRFEAVFISGDLENSAYSYSGNFTDTQKEMLKNTRRGSKIYITKIRIKTDNRIIDLLGVTFRLTRYEYIDESLNLVTLGGIEGGLITKKAIIDDPYIRLNKDVGTIIRFTFYTNLAGYVYEISSGGDKFTPQMISTIKDLRIGKRFTIRDVRIRKPGGETITANERVFKLK